jgi:hypothetical protein
MKIQQRYCQGLSASWYSQQRTVEEDTASATPRCTAPRASPGTQIRDVPGCRMTMVNGEV